MEKFIAEEPRDSSQISKSEHEIHSLLDHRDKLNGAERPRKWRLASRTGVVLAVLMLVYVTLLGAMVVIARGYHEPGRPSWMPAENWVKNTFAFHSIYAGEPSDLSEELWTNLIPMGKGWINVTREQASQLPDLPKLDRSLPDQKALLSVFHQMHCLYMTRAGFFAARDGRMDTVNTTHLYHCWDYLRQAIMCAGDTTLEWKPADDIGSTGWGYQHVCKDYTTLFNFAEANRYSDKKVIHAK
ncbi:hypothetical protein LY78DRAFT_726910 [Colletotrichum sublineola]|uniref:Tat pathway signal sequence n=1 Tax=Colletotrichum sublineola TaxID=1173701 RepID=A0A066XLQ7_COLSU|nr:hypothetical protein LY78DRAFT_726910 [Colletotrichum sublineola]KDN68584.1 hypothetical protein CSUB01_10606 [Colletotrichum sublineola]